MVADPGEKTYSTPFGQLTLQELNSIAEKAHKEMEFELRDWVESIVDKYREQEEKGE